MNRKPTKILIVYNGMNIKLIEEKNSQKKLIEEKKFSFIEIWVICVLEFQ